MRSYLLCPLFTFLSLKKLTQPTKIKLIPTMQEMVPIPRVTPPKKTQLHTWPPHEEGLTEVDISLGKRT